MKWTPLLLAFFGIGVQVYGLVIDQPGIIVVGTLMLAFGMLGHLWLVSRGSFGTKL